MLNRPTQQAPAGDVFALPAKHAVSVGGTSFRFYEAGSLALRYVDGALPWLANSGDRFAYADLIAPPRMLSVESDGHEVEYFHGYYLTPAEVWAGLRRSDAPPRPAGRAPRPALPPRAAAKALMVVGSLFALLNLGLLGWSAGRDGQHAPRADLPASEYLGEALSQPFAVGPEPVMGLDHQRAALRLLARRSTRRWSTARSRSSRRWTATSPTTPASRRARAGARAASARPPTSRRPRRGPTG